MIELDDRRLRALLAVALMLVGLGLWAFVLRGADGPADPSLEEPLGGTTEAPRLPGDPNRVRLEGFDEVAVSVEAEPGTFAWCLLAALTAEQRARGLMEVTDLQGYEGMVFVYQDDVANGFYMRNTPTPLSIAWIAADGSVVGTADMEPCEDREGCPSYPPPATYRYAIEVEQGRLADLGITESAIVRVGGECAAVT